MDGCKEIKNITGKTRTFQSVYNIISLRRDIDYKSDISHLKSIYSLDYRT